MITVRRHPQKFAAAHGRPTLRTSSRALSQNPRLELVFPFHRSYFNCEFTLPCMWERVWVDPRIEGTPAQQRIEENLRVIITTDQQEKLPPGADAHVRVLASPYQCGRVLEIDEKITVDGERFVGVLKGVGATRYIRLGLPNPMQTPVYAPIELKRRAFHGEVGVFDLNAALREKNIADQERSGGIDVEDVWGIYRILEMPDEKGLPKPLEYFYEHHWIHHTLVPVIMVRGLKTNFRLSDPLTLNFLEQGSSIPALVAHILDEFAAHNRLTSPHLCTYQTWLADKVIRQGLQWSLRGYPVGANWFSVARNTSMLGQDIDLEAMEIVPQALSSTGDYRHHIERQFILTCMALGSFMTVINNYDTTAIDPDDFVEIARTTIAQTIEAYQPPLKVNRDFKPHLIHALQQWADRTMKHLIR